MEHKNKYYRRSHISERKLRQLVHYFTLDLSAADVAQLTGLTRKTVNTIFLRIRRRLVEACERSSTLPASELQLAADDYLNRGPSNAAVDDGTSPISRDDMPDSFRSFARKRLQKFRGISDRTLNLHLKECEWRYNMRQRDLYAELLKLLREHPL